MCDYTFLQNLNQGDKVVYVSNYGSTRELATVTHVTPKFVTVRGSRFRRTDGQQVSASNWYGATIEEATPEVVATLQTQERHSRRVRALRAIFDKPEHTSHIPAETLDAVWELIRPYVEAAKPDKPGS